MKKRFKKQVSEKSPIDSLNEIQTKDVLIAKASTDYENNYLLKNGLSNRETVYIAKDLKNKLSDIVMAMGNRELTVGMYLENIVLRHIEEKRDTIITLSETKFKKPL